MQVLINGKPELNFDAKKERKLSVVPVREFAEGKVISEEDMVGGLRRRLGLIYGVLGTVAAFFFVGMPFMDLREDGIILPVDLVIAASLYFLLRFMFRRNIAKEAAAAGPRLKRMGMLAGSTVRADPGGLTTGVHVTPWSDLTIETVEITHTSGGDDAEISFIAALLMTAAGKPIVLDHAAITNGRLIVDYAWRQLRGH